MRRGIVLSALTVLLAGSAASAEVVAKYRDDFTLAGPPKAGWTYQWNATGPIEGAPNILNFGVLANLLRDTSGNFESAADGAYPDPAPAVFLAATPTSLFPGQSASEAADGNSRWAIASYTLQASDIAAFGSSAIMDTYSFGIPPESADGITARIYLNGFRIVQSPLPPDFVFDQNSEGAYPIPFGDLLAGDTITVAVGAGATSTGDRLDLSFTITLVPEPAMLSVGAMAVGLLAMRRRNR